MYSAVTRSSVALSVNAPRASKICSTACSTVAGLPWWPNAPSRAPGASRTDCRLGHEPRRATRHRRARAPPRRHAGGLERARRWTVERPTGARGWRGSTATSRSVRETTSLAPGGPQHGDLRYVGEGLTHRRVPIPYQSSGKEVRFGGMIRGVAIGDEQPQASANLTAPERRDIVWVATIRA